MKRSEEEEYFSEDKEKALRAVGGPLAVGDFALEYFALEALRALDRVG